MLYTVATGQLFHPNRVAIALRPGPAVAASTTERPSPPMAALQQALRAYRSQKATQLSQPAFCVFSNAELDGLVAACPHSVSELLGVKARAIMLSSLHGLALSRDCAELTRDSGTWMREG